MKTKNKKSAPAALKPLCRVVLTAHTATFSNGGEVEPYSTLGYGAPGSDANAATHREINRLKATHRVVITHQ